MGNGDSMVETCRSIQFEGPITIKVEGGHKREILLEVSDIDPAIFTIGDLKQKFKDKFKTEPINQKYYHNNLRLDPKGTLKQHKIKNNDILSVLYGRNVFDSE